MHPSLVRLSASIGAALRPAHSPDGAEGRAKERVRRAGLTAVTAAVARASTFISSALTVPLAIGALGTEQFGLWLALQAVVNSFVFADLGVGAAVKNAVASARATGDPARVRIVTGSAYIVISGIALACAAVLLVVVLLRGTDVASILGLPPALHREANVAAIVLFTLFCLNMPLSLTSQIQTGMQSGYVAQLWLSAAALCTPLAVGLAMWQVPRVAVLAVAAAGTPVLFMALNTFVFLVRGHGMVRLLPLGFDKSCATSLLHNGLHFLTLAIAAAVAFTSDNIVLSRMLGPAAVTKYAIAYQMCAVLQALPGIAFGALWPAYTDAIARGDVDWAATTLRRVVKVSLLVIVPLALVPVIWGPGVARWWTLGHVEPTHLLMAGMALWAVLVAIGGLVATFLYSVGVLRFQVLQAVAFAGAALALKVFAATGKGEGGRLCERFGLYRFHHPVCAVRSGAAGADGVGRRCARLSASVGERNGLLARGSVETPECHSGRLARASGNSSLRPFSCGLAGIRCRSVTNTTCVGR